VTPTEHLNLVRKKLDSLVKLRLSRPLDPRSEETYRALCDREQELLKTARRDPAPVCPAPNKQAEPPVWAGPPELVNGWSSLLETSPSYDNAEAQLGPWSETSAVYWPFP
jgi:hypothetical protein